MTGSHILECTAERATAPSLPEQTEVTMTAVQLARSGRFLKAKPLEEELAQLWPEASPEQYRQALADVARAYAWVLDRPDLA